MKLDFDLDEGTVDFEVPKGPYTEEGLRLAGQVLSSKAAAYASEEKGGWEVSLESKRKGTTREQLRALAGEFYNEILNQEYRAIVGTFNRNVTDVIVTQALYSARGGDEKPPQADEKTPEFKKAVDELLARTREEIRRTMPKKIASKGRPVPPPKGES